MFINLSDRQIILILLVICFAVLIYLIYNISVNEYMSSKYNALSLDTQYHDSIEDIRRQSGLSEPNDIMVKIIDKYGNKVEIPVSRTFGNPTYFKPGTYRYGSATYVPTYEDSVYLSKSLNPTPIDNKIYDNKSRAKSKTDSYVKDIKYKQMKKINYQKMNPLQK